MHYQFTGRLCVRPCPELTRPLAGSTIVLYRPDEDLDPALAAARPKRSFDAVSPAQDDLPAIGDAEIDEGGRFEVSIDEKAYDGGPVVIAVLVDDPAGREDVSPVEHAITVHEPEWEESETGQIARWEYCLTEKQWCHVLEQLSCRMVCGRVLDCGAQEETPIPGVTVRARDADIVQHEALGSAVTAGDGGYTIYYTESDFEEVPPPFLPVELTHGPDLFFEVETAGGDPLLEEGPSDGREPGREDVGRCAHADLCVDLPGEAAQMAWFSVGSAFDVPDADSLNDFDAAGYAGAKKWALFGTLSMRGNTPSVTDPDYDDVQYRFRFAESTAENDDPAMDEAAFTDAVGDIDNADAFRRTKIGVAVRYAPFDFFPVHARQADVDEDGWLSVDSALSNSAPDDVDPAAYEFYDNDSLMRVDTTALTTQSNPADASVDPGDPFPADETVDVERFAVRFEARVVESDGSVTPVPASGQTLNRAVVDNSGTFGALEIAELAGDSCDPITTDGVTAAYTIYHPHPGSAQLRLIANDEDETDASAWTEIDDPAGTSELSFVRGEESGADLLALDGESYNGSLDVSGEVSRPCTYMLELRTQRRLHNGNTAADSGWQTHRLVAFHAEEP
ncbi:hypothetical protein [Halovivax limisalsi]|uniref:hypothetical protein n=1 Tax=Halovivax limisalsi TaxID=1453760 RepID=UPI001FFCE8A1|nr:hypothetical protein [Halovivax limisalsi]